MAGFMHHQISGANTFGSTMAKLGHPSEVDYKYMVRSNMINHCPVTPSYIGVANKIFVRDILSLKGETGRMYPPLLVSECVSTPRQIKCINHWLTVSTDAMFVSGIAFLLSVSRGLKTYNSGVHAKFHSSCTF